MVLCTLYEEELEVFIEATCVDRPFLLKFIAGFQGVCSLLLQRQDGGYCLDDKSDNEKNALELST